MRPSAIAASSAAVIALLTGQAWADSGAAPTPLLTWPGKTNTDQAAPTLRGGPAMPAPVIAAQPQSEPARRATLPTSIYAPATPRSAAIPPGKTVAASAVQAPAAKPTTVASASGANKGLPPHTYSVARDYGQKPDSDKLPDQFFAPTPGGDLAAPPPPLMPNPVPGSQTVSNTSNLNTPANRARAIALETQSPDGDPN